MTTLHIRLPARAEGEGASCRYAQVGEGGAIVQQGEGPLRTLTDLVAASRRVLLVLAASDVTLLAVSAPPLSGARLKAALPGLVEEHILGDPADAVLVAGPTLPDASRVIAVVERDWFAAIVRTVLAQGARSVRALPAQLCLPARPGMAAAAVGDGELVLRHSAWQGLGLALDGQAPLVLQTARALAGEAPLVLYVPPAQLGEYQALAAEAGGGIEVEADHWAHWLHGADSATLDLVPGLGAAGLPARDWRRWRWPLRLAVLALLVNVAGLNIDWLRQRSEAQRLRQGMEQTYRAAFPGEPVVDPVAQLRQHLARARADAGQLGGDEFLALAAAFGEALRGLPRPPVLAALEYKERSLTVRVKPESVDPGLSGQLRGALAARGLSLEETAPATWQVRSTGATP